MITNAPNPTDAMTDRLFVAVQPPRPPVPQPHQAKRSRRAAFAGALATVLVSAVVGSAAAVAAEHCLPTHPLLVAPNAANQSASAGSVEQAAAKVLPSVVQLEIKVGTQEEVGSGIVLTPDGLVLTNNHVVAGSGGPGDKQNLAILDDGRTAPFTLVGTDPMTDIAVVRIQGVSGLTPISFGSSAKLRVGQQVVAVGSPLGLQSTVTSGIISALHRPYFAEDDPNQALYEAIQTDASINPGNSGGALIDLTGELIGINSGLKGLNASADTQAGSVGLGFAIPADLAKRISDELIATGHASHADLGVRVAADLSVNGARISSVTGGGPAAGVGLPAGAVVTKLDDELITGPAALVAAVRAKAPGTPVTVSYLDLSLSTKTVIITLGSQQISQPLDKAGNDIPT